jgi:hypothetical protein
MLNCIRSQNFKRQFPKLYELFRDLNQSVFSDCPQEILSDFREMISPVNQPKNLIKYGI